MKPIITFILSIGFGVATLQAQTDSSKARQPNNQVLPQEQRSHPTKDMVKVDAAKIPDGLKKTLENSEYAGWKEGTLYYDTKTQEYALLMPSISSSEASAKYNTEIMGKKNPAHTGWYFFTKEGKRIFD